MPGLRRRHAGRWRRWCLLPGLLVAAMLCAVDRWIETAVLPPLDPALSEVQLDHSGAPLHVRLAADGRWRLPLSTDDVDPAYLAALIAYEDRRFHDHAGIDPLAVIRAAGQALWHGRAVSGASTLSMQVARLMDGGGSTRSIRAKLRQIRLALALERRLDKSAILDLYLLRAPFGGNLEGVRAASLAWFAKEPRRLSPAEIALLVAIPQAPETRRPDRAPKAAMAARNRVLSRLSGTVFDPADIALARKAPIARHLHPFPRLAPHQADRYRGDGPLAIDARLQERLEHLARLRGGALPRGLSLAVLVVDHRTGAVRASIGAPDRLDTSRAGYVDMTRAIRSPGSTLKPTIYGLAFDLGRAHPETMIDDRPRRFDGYAPGNFDGRFLGTMTLRRALGLSRNVPAVALLDAVGPARLSARLARIGVETRLPGGARPGLAMALGGVGLSLRDLTATAAAIARGGRGITLRDRADAPIRETGPLMGPVAAWYVTDVLRDAPPPPGAPQGRIAFKTGTSYGHRDAWAIGWDGTHAVGVWIGRPDGTAAPGLSGLDAAAPLLFETFARIAPTTAPFPPPPRDALMVDSAALPAPLARFERNADAAPAIAFPPDGAEIALSRGRLVLKVADGVPPFTWLANGAAAGTVDDRTMILRPDGPGYLTLAVIDGSGKAARAEVRIAAPGG